MADLTDRFTAALVQAATWHAGQRRKTKAVPYVAHLLVVAGWVLEDGGDEDQAIAALLHDAVEDTETCVAAIAVMFGDEVARIVDACSDADAQPKPPWLERKVHHLERLAHADAAVVRVTAADKLHNCSDTLADVRERGVGVFDRFGGARQGTCWYYAAMWSLLDERATALGLGGRRLIDELGTAARDLHEAAGLAFPADRPTPTG